MSNSESAALLDMMSGEPMKAGDLDFYALLRRKTGEGSIFFNKQRAVIFDVDALGTLRQQLLDTMGTRRAMGVLSRFGYTHGYKDAQILGQNFEWETEAEWLGAGPTIYSLAGMAQATVETIEFDRQTGSFLMKGSWQNSFEAKEHLKQYGPALHPVCWSLTGYASGYGSAFFGQELLAIETACVGQGDDCCRWEIRPIDQWGDQAKLYLEALQPMDRAEQQISASTDALDALPQSVYRVDRQGRVTYGNKAYLNAIGMSLEECLGKTAYDFFPRELADKYTADDRWVMETGKTIDVVESHEAPTTGQTSYVHTVKVPARDSSGQIVGVQGIFWEVTERIKTEQALAKRATELETVAEVSVAASTILDTQKLLQTVADLTKNRFNLYHAHIYLLDQAGDTLKLAAGAGDIGRQMVSKGWSIPLNRAQSLVAHTARSRKGIIVNDVRQHPDYFQNPLLPHTRSELAVPMLVGHQLLGVLDVQADTPNYFTEAELRIQSTLANQVAAAIRNVRLFENVVQARKETEELLREAQISQQLTQSLAGALGINEVANAFLHACTRLLGFDYAIFSLVDEQAQRVKAIKGMNVTDDHIERANHPLDSDDIMADIIRTGQTEIITGWDPRFDPENFEAEGMADWGMKVFTPIALRDEHIGLVEVGFNKNVDETIQDSQIKLLRSLIDQTAVSLESARLYSQTQTALAEAEAAQRRYTVQAWEAYRSRDILRSVEKVNQEEETPAYDLQAEIKQAVTAKQTVVVGTAPERQADGGRQESIKKDCGGVVVPLTVRDEVIGVIGLQENDPAKTWSDEEIALVQAIAEQIAQAAENIRLLDDSQQRAAREQRVNEIGDKIQAAQSLEEALQIAVKEVGLSLKAPQTTVKLTVK